MWCTIRCVLLLIVFLFPFLLTALGGLKPPDEAQVTDEVATLWPAFWLVSIVMGIITPLFALNPSLWGVGVQNKPSFSNSFMDYRQPVNIFHQGFAMLSAFSLSYSIVVIAFPSRWPNTQWPPIWLISGTMALTGLATVYLLPVFFPHRFDH